MQSDKDYHNFYLFQIQKRKEHRAPRGPGAQILDVMQLMAKVADISLKNEQERCDHFLVEGEMETGRHIVFNSLMDSLNPKHLLEKIDTVFDSLKCAAKLNEAFGFVLKNVQHGKWR